MGFDFLWLCILFVTGLPSCFENLTACTQHSSAIKPFVIITTEITSANNNLKKKQQKKYNKWITTKNYPHP